MLAVTGHGNSWFTTYSHSCKSVLRVSLQDAFYSAGSIRFLKKKLFCSLIYQIKLINNINMSIEENVNAGVGGDPYENFRSLLQQSIVFPTEYTFKFIIKAEEDKIAELKSMFANAPAKITENSSSTGKYKSFTVQVLVQDEEEVIAYYKEVSKINSVIML